MNYDDMDMRWSAARLGAVRVDSDGQRWVTVEVPHDGDPREDVRQLLSDLDAAHVFAGRESDMESDMERYEAAQERADELLRKRGKKEGK